MGDLKQGGKRERLRACRPPSLDSMRLTWSLFCFWLIVLVTVLPTEVGGEEEAVSLDAPDESKYAEKYPPVVVKGLRNVKEWERENKQLEATNNRLRKRLSVPWKTKLSKDCCKYSEIPWFKFGFMGKRYTNKSAGDCRALCNQYIGCKSYSYRYKDRTCIYSSDAVTYDSDWRFYSKKYDNKGKPVGTYHMFPGMKFLQPFTKVETKSLPECKYACTKDLGCGSFSYDTTQNKCSVSGSKIGYAPDFHYYEKDLSNLKKPGFKEKHDKENAAKETLKEEYMHNIDKARRKEAADHKKELAKKKTLEAKAKKESKRDAALAKKSEQYRKVVARCKEKNKKILGEKNKLVTTMATIRKNSEGLTKKRLKVHHNEKKAKLNTKIKTLQKNLGERWREHIQIDMKEKNQKVENRKQKEKARKTVEKKHKEDRRLRKQDRATFKASQKSKIARDKRVNSTCKINENEKKTKATESTKQEKAAKTSLARKEFVVGYWAKKVKLATTERRKKKTIEGLKEAKESMNKAKSEETRRIKETARAANKNQKIKEMCDKKKAAMTARERKLKKQQAEQSHKQKIKEENEKESLKEAAAK